MSADADDRLQRRTRVHARALEGRIWYTPGRIFLVQGPPDPERLLGCLEGLNAVPEAGACPTPADLGFPAAAVVLASRSGVASRSRSLQKWRAGIAHEQARGRVRPARQEKLAGWLAEIERLSAQVAALHRLLADEEPAGSPYWLATAAELDAAIAEAAGGRVVPDEVRWLARLVSWLTGTRALRRWLTTVCDGLVFPADHEARAALLRVRERATRLLAYLRRLDPLGRFDLEDGEARDQAQRTYDRERRESPLFAALREAAAGLPEVSIPPRNREIDPEQVIEQCDAALARLPRSPAWPELARLAALYACDGGSVALPWAFAANHLTGDRYDGRYASQLLLETSREPAYDALLALLARLPDCDSWRIDQLARLLRAGASPDELCWLHRTCRYFPPLGDGSNLPAVRQAVEWLAAHDAALDEEEIEELLEATSEPAGRSGLESLVRYLDWLPPGTATAPLARGVRGLVRLLAVPGSLRGPVRDRFRLWADPPSRSPLPAGSPDGLPAELRSLLRRLASYQRAAGQPDRLPGSLRRPLDSAARAERERLYLRQHRASLDAKQQARLQRLEARTEADPAAASARLLRQAREVTALAALDAARALIRGEVESFWRQRLGLDPALESFAWDDLAALTCWLEELRAGDRARVERILTAYHEHGPAYREYLPENAGWLAQLRGTGRDLDAWLRPPPGRFEPAEGGPLALAVATDPRAVFLMGSWFRTCLALGHGSNRAAVIANAADANKAVVYAWSPDGRPLARKLVAVGPDLRLLGYRAYVRDDAPDELAAALDTYCAAWAARAGFALADGGRPLALGGGFWYDDGIQPWSSDARDAWERAGPATRAEGVPPALADPVEEAWVDAVRSDDPRALERFLASAGDCEWRTSALFWWLTRFPTRPDRRADWGVRIAQGGWEVLGHQFAAGRCTGRASLHFWEPPASEANSDAIAVGLRSLWSVPPEPRFLSAAIAEIGRIEGASRDGHDCFYCFGGPVPAVGLVPVGDILRLLRTLVRVMYHMRSCVNPSWTDRWAQALRQAWLRDQDAGPLVRALRGGEPFVREALIELCRLEPIPELARELAREQRRTTDAGVRARIAATLAVWGSPHDRQRRDPASAPAEAASIATDPRRPLAERAAAIEACWPLDPNELWTRDRLAAAYATTFTDAERTALPAELRHRFADTLVTEVGHDSLQARLWPLLLWMRTFPPAEQVALWRANERGMKALEYWQASEAALLLQALQAADTTTVEAAHCALVAAAEGCPPVLVKWLDDVFVWLHPDRSEAVARAVLPHVADGAAIVTAPVRSSRLRRLLAGAS